MLNVTCVDQFSIVLQLVLGDQNYVFTGNSNAGSSVTTTLPWPVYTSKIRLYPVTYQSGIELAFRVYGYAQGKIMQLV